MDKGFFYTLSQISDWHKSLIQHGALQLCCFGLIMVASWCIRDIIDFTHVKNLCTAANHSEFDIVIIFYGPGFVLYSYRHQRSLCSTAGMTARQFLWHHHSRYVRLWGFSPILFSVTLLIAWCMLTFACTH